MDVSNPKHPIAKISELSELRGQLFEGRLGLGVPSDIGTEYLAPYPAAGRRSTSGGRRPTASTATHPSAWTITGFNSSRSSPESSSSDPTPAATIAAASMSTAGVPRAPVSAGAPRNERIAALQRS